MLDVEIHPNFRTLMEQKGFLIYMVQDIYAHKGKGCFFLNDLKVSLAPTPRKKKTIHVMFVETNHTQEQKKPKVCDWNHLSLSVTVPAKPTSRRDRDSELTQPHFSTQTKTFEHKDQNATKITSALADPCIQFPGFWPMMSLCLSSVFYDHFSHGVLPSFFSQNRFKSRERRGCWDEQIVIPETIVYRK